MGFLADFIMNLKLERPIAFFDVETTGVNVVSDRIVTISVLKVHPNGKKDGKTAIINPEIPIPTKASEIHGITDEMVLDKPKFKQIAKSLFDFMANCDIGGYNNNNFDNIILSEEFRRAGIDFPQGEIRSIDACAIFKKMEQRTLEAAYKYYCGKELEDAHTSHADTQATYEVFIKQLERYSELHGMNIDELSKFCQTDNRADMAGKVIIDENGDYLYNFGKHKGQKVIENPDYADWMLNSDFPSNTKVVLRKILEKLNKNPF